MAAKISTLPCGVTEAPVVVRVVKVFVSPSGIESPPVPVSGATVRFTAGTFIFATSTIKTTDPNGIAQACFTLPREVKTEIYKPDEDFGSGKGVFHNLGTTGFRTALYIFEAKSVHKETILIPTITPTAPEIPCFGELGMNLSNIYDTLSKSPTLPSSLNVPVYITNATGNIGSTKINIFIGETNVGSVFAGQSIDLIRVLTGRVPNIATSNRITLVPESLCIKEKTFDIPPLIPTGIGLPPPPPSCSDIKTTVESVNHDPSLPSTPSTPFFISINKIKLECPSNPSLTKKMTGEVGTVTLGSLSAQFPIPSPGQSEGEVYFDLSKLVDLSKILKGTPSPPLIINQEDLTILLGSKYPAGGKVCREGDCAVGSWGFGINAPINNQSDYNKNFEILKATGRYNQKTGNVL